MDTEKRVDIHFRDFRLRALVNRFSGGLGYQPHPTIPRYSWYAVFLAK